MNFINLTRMLVNKKSCSKTELFKFRDVCKPRFDCIEILLTFLCGFYLTLNAFNKCFDSLFRKCGTPSFFTANV